MGGRGGCGRSHAPQRADPLLVRPDDRGRVMDTATLRAYREERGRGTPAKPALSIARYRTAPLRLDWHSDRQGRDTASFPQDGFTIRVVVDPDWGTDPFEGQTFDHPEPGAVRIDRDEWWLPGSGETLPGLAEAYRKTMARGPAWEAARLSLIAEHDD